MHNTINLIGIIGCTVLLCVLAYWLGSENGYYTRSKEFEESKFDFENKNKKS
jgi:hypothetical protein